MRIIKILFPFLLISILSCDQHSQSKDPEKKLSDSLRQKMIGIWGGPPEEGHPTLDIRVDSIYYFQHDKAYSYELIGDTLSVKFPDRDSATVFGKVSIEKDTMKILDFTYYNTVTKAYQRK